MEEEDDAGRWTEKKRGFIERRRSRVRMPLGTELQAAAAAAAEAAEVGLAIRLLAWRPERSRRRALLEGTTWVNGNGGSSSGGSSSNSSNSNSVYVDGAATAAAATAATATACM